MTETPQEPAAPAPAPAPAQPQPQQQGNGLAMAGMVLGIIALATSWMFCAVYIPIATGVVGLILSILGKGKAAKIGGVGAGKAKAGMICSIIGLVVGVVLLILILTVFATAASSLQEEMERMRQMQPPETSMLILKAWLA